MPLNRTPAGAACEQEFLENSWFSAETKEFRRTHCTGSKIKAPGGESRFAGNRVAAVSVLEAINVTGAKCALLRVSSTGWQARRSGGNLGADEFRDDIGEVR